MRQKNREVFNDKKKLEEMLNLRRQGWTYTSLALVYGVDHSSIYGQCKKYKVKSPPDKINLLIPSIISLIGIHIRPLKSYKEYIEEERRRKFPKLYGGVSTL